MRKRKLLTTNMDALLPYAAIILAVGIWGAATVVIKITTQYIPPFTFLFIRFLMVGIIMLPIFYLLTKANPIDRRDYKNLILLGISGYTSMAFVFWSLYYTTAIEVSIIGVLATILTIALGHYFYNDGINTETKTGIGIATLGMLVIVLQPLLTTDQIGNYTVLERLFGNTLAVIYSISFTIYIVWSKSVMGQRSHKLTSALRFMHLQPMKKTYSPVVHTTFGFYVGLVTMLPFALLEHMGYIGHFAFRWADLNPIAIAGLLYMVFFSSIVAYIAFEWGLQQSHVKDSAIFSYLGPLFTIPVAFLILGEIPSSLTVVASMFIALGVLIAEKHKS
jgi:drug/metabolite transporter (DMT)-like permease